MSNLKLVAAFAGACLLSFMAGRIPFEATSVQAQERTFTALDYQEITQLINRYAYGIDTCANNGYDYADVFTPDGVFIDKNSDAGFKANGRVLARGREALATLVGGGSRGCKTKLVWTDWSHLMLNHEITPTPQGAKGRVYLVQMGMKGPGTVERHGGYEDLYVRTAAGWRIQSRTHVRDKAWHNSLLQTPDLN
ncbi:MAG TPA: nuclear transport factor 2 family protein [Vicinamibacterales bacterium]|nr:nuclear transport factor 2 family protein [Vicinamibacterales bacterium]